MCIDISKLFMGFWHFDIGNVATWGGLLFSVFLWVLRYNRSLTEVRIWLEELTKGHKSLAEVVERMNSAGTSFSQKLMAVEAEMTRQNTRRIELLENISARVGPDIAKIAVDLEWIKRDMKANGKN